MTKIARLPPHIRNQLGQRLASGADDQPTLDWLNQLPEVQHLASPAPGQTSITDEALADWKQGGHLQWLADQQACDMVRHLAELADDLHASTEEQPVSDCLAAFLAAELARSAQSPLAETTTPAERWHRLRELLLELARLRKGDHNALRVQMERERWDRQQQRLDDGQHERTMRRLKNQAVAPLWAHLLKGPLAETFGGGELGAQTADSILAIEHDLPIPKPSAAEPTGHHPPEPAASI